jgi:hypothetical protein
VVACPLEGLVRRVASQQAISVDLHLPSSTNITSTSCFTKVLAKILINHYSTHINYDIQENTNCGSFRIACLEACDRDVMLKKSNTLEQ